MSTTALCVAARSSDRQSLRWKKNQWINAKDRLPATDDAVLAITSGKPMTNITLDGAYVFASYFSEDGWIIDEYPEWEAVNVTHWMPLPDPPKEG